MFLLGLSFFGFEFKAFLIDDLLKTIRTSVVCGAIDADQLDGFGIDRERAAGQRARTVYAAIRVLGFFVCAQKRTSPEDLAASAAMRALALSPCFVARDIGPIKEAAPCVVQFDAVMAGATTDAFDIPQHHHPVQRAHKDHKPQRNKSLGVVYDLRGQRFLLFLRCFRSGRWRALVCGRGLRRR